MDTFTDPDAANAVSAIPEDECLALLATEHLGRLALHIDERLEIFPVNYVTHRGKIYFKTAEGTKLMAVTLQHFVAFEVDRIGEDTAWSVIVRGTAKHLKSAQDIEEAAALDLHSWVPTTKRNYVTITPTEITGRRILLDREAD